VKRETELVAARWRTVQEKMKDFCRPSPSEFQPRLFSDVIMNERVCCDKKDSN